MKVYNINNGKAFFEELAACKGAVEMVGEDGRHLPITTAMTCFQGMIRELELVFADQEDCSRILSYLMNKRGLAA